MNAAVTAWMLFSLLTGAVVCVAAIAAADAQRAARRPERWVWMLAIALIAVLGALAPLRQAHAPRDGVSVSRAVSVAATATAGRTSAAGLAVRALRWFATPTETAMRVVQRAAEHAPAAVHRLIAVAWAAASALTLVLFAGSWRRARRVVTRCPSQRIDGVAVRVSRAAGPAVIGLMPPEIVVPRWLLERSPDERRMVIAHEQEHVRARDPWLLAAACVAIVLMPWHPALWFAFARLRFAVELDCDRRVLRRGVAPAAYGALLIDLSALRSALPSAMPAFTCNGSYLERRLVTMTSLTSRLATPRRIAGGLLAAAALLAACESKLPTSAEIERMDGAAVVQQAGPLVMRGSGDVHYFVDEVPVTAEQAKALDASSIASVNVQKGKGDGAGEVRIVTHLAAKVALDRSIAEGTARPDAADVVKKLQVVHETAEAADAPVLVKKAFDGLLVVDGAIVDASMLKSLSPDRIESVDVLKGEAAAAAYTDPRAARGVIRITTKRAP